MIITIKSTYNPIYQETINGSVCPKCGNSENLELTIYQLHTDSGFIYAVTKRLTGSIYCNSCKQEIENVLWTPEMEAWLDKAKQNATIEKPYKKFSIIYKALITFLIIFFSVITYFGVSMYFENQGKQAILKNPTVNDKFLVSHGIRKSYSETEDLGISWATIRKVKADTLFIQFNTKVLQIQDVNGASAPSDGYDGKTYKVSKKIMTDKERFTEFDKKHLGLNGAFIWAYSK